MSEHAAIMTEEEYRSDPGVNKSTLWEIRKSPAHYKWALEHPTEDTPALKFGRAVHMAVLQPEEFRRSYAVVPEGIDRRTKEGKATWAAFLAEHEGQEYLTQDEFEQLNEISMSVKREAGWLLEGCDTEVPLFWDDPRTGIRCKGRVDAMKELPDKLVMIDLKTTRDASTGAFARAAVNMGYHVQAAHYMTGAVQIGLNHKKPVEWWFIAVEKDAPFAVNLIRAREAFMDEGMFRLAGLMDRLDECLREDKWPGYGENELILPKWMGSEEEE